MKNRWVHLRVSEKEKETFKVAAQVFSKASGEKINVSKTILTLAEKYATSDQNK